MDAARFGAFTDFDIGGSGDDYVGCDTTVNMFFGYNADGYDSDGPGDAEGYLDDPPAQAIAFLNQTMTAHSYYGSIGPNSALGSYNLLSGLQANGDPVTTSGGDTTSFLYSGDPNDPLQWHEASIGNAPSDRRAIGSIGPFTFAPGDTICVDLAFVFAQDTLGDNLTSVTLLKQRVAQVRDWYAQQDINCTGSYGVVTGLSNPQTSLDGFELFPNPATGVLSLSRTIGKSASVQVFSTTGSLLAVAGWPAGSNRLTLDVSALPAGVHLIVVQDNGRRTIKRFVKSDG
ncbi:MAG: T9SS type A sorting domain-containing protein [Flavobacteriales bacterium]|nr:T9SS type A sorting domain-containing protein [Flavobacteriales bacterium]